MSKRRRISDFTSMASSAGPRHTHRRSNRSGVWIGLGIAAVVLVAGAILLLRPKGSLPPQMSAAQAHEAYQQGALFLDVRTQEEWAQARIAGSVLIPLDELAARLSELPRDRDIVVVCRSGPRSTEGAAILRQAGFTRVSCLDGGLESWVAAGYPLEQ